MFGRVTAECVKHAVSRVRHHAIRSHHNIRHVAGQIDHAVSIAAHVYKAAQPALKHYAPECEKKRTRHASNAKCRYNDLREEASNAHTMASGVVKGIQKKVPELRL